MTNADFLFEIGTEELPPKVLKKIAVAFFDNVRNELINNELEFSDIKWFATPRRLAILISGLSESQPDQAVERRGPSLKACYDENKNPTKALEKFVDSCGVSIDQLKNLETEKGAWVVCHLIQKGKTVFEIMPDIIQKALNKLPVPKPMRWGSKNDLFIRPVHWLVMMYGKTIVNAGMFGLSSSNQSTGHRFHCKKAINIDQPKNYEKLLESKGKVIVDFEKRRSEIVRKSNEAAKNEKATLVIKDDLLDEVTGLVEWPVPLLCSFEEHFLDVPTEALISEIEGNQRCFYLEDNNQKMSPLFIAISNIESTDPKRVIEGNERVMRARLSDAEFFYQSDIKQKLADRVDGLKQVVFQDKLGSLGDKTTRISMLAQFIAGKLNADKSLTERAATLCKADLLSDMVGEFPDLQGTMGYYYAINDKEPREVALGIKEHYLPRFAKDNLPTAPIGCALAIADRLDTLVGIFGINKIPSGEKDPFALRRAALGVLRIIVEREFDIDLRACLDKSEGLYVDKLENREAVEQVFDFMNDRFKAWYAEQGIPSDVFAAVLANKPTRPFDFHKRIQAVNRFRQLPQAEALAMANKRVSNILTKQATGIKINAVDPRLLIENEEKHLATEILNKREVVEPYFTDGKYTEALTELAELQKPIDDFFDHVMVMVDDEETRNNRIALLSTLRDLFIQVADISLLQ